MGNSIRILRGREHGAAQAADLAADARNNLNFRRCADPTHDQSAVLTQRADEHFKQQTARGVFGHIRGNAAHRIDQHAQQLLSAALAADDDRTNLPRFLLRHVGAQTVVGAVDLDGHRTAIKHRSHFKSLRLRRTNALTVDHSAVLARTILDRCAFCVESNDRVLARNRWILKPHIAMRQPPNHQPPARQ